MKQMNPKHREGNIRTSKVCASSKFSNRIINFFHIIDRRIIVFLSVFITIMAAVIAYTMTAPVKYTTKTELYATYSNAIESDGNYGNMNNASSYIENVIQSYPNLARTETVLNPVLEELRITPSASALSSLASKIEVTTPKNTHIVDISVVDTDPARAVIIADSVAHSLCAYASPQGEQSPISLTVVQPAVIPTSPSAPRMKFNMIAGACAACALGILASYGYTLFTRRVQRVEELQHLLQAPILGTIPSSDQLMSGTPIIMREPNSPLAERFRNLRTNMTFMEPVPHTRTRIIVLSSVDINEGKSTTSVNLASALAEHGNRVLLIDTDLRHPSLEKNLNVIPKGGLVDVLAGKTTMEQAIYRYLPGKFHILTSGERAGNATVLLNSQAMKDILQWTHQYYDYVILDTAPLIVANDAAVFAQQGAQLVIVARQGSTNKKDLSIVQRNLENLGVSVAGIIATCTKESINKANKQYYYYQKDNDSINIDINKVENQRRIRAGRIDSMPPVPSYSEKSM